MVLRHRLIVALAASVLFGAPGCKRKSSQPDAGPPEQKASDHLAPGELPEGTEKAFALTLPRAAKVTGHFGSEILVLSRHSPEEVSNFLRTRVTEGSISAGTSSTVFENVIVAAEPTRRLTIQVRPAKLATGYRTEMVVRDVTPTLPPGTSEEDRWKAAGMTPDGRLIDPKHMQ